MVILKCDETLNMTKKPQNYVQIGCRVSELVLIPCKRPSQWSWCQPVQGSPESWPSICQVCDSDTRLDPHGAAGAGAGAGEDPHVGAVAGVIYGSLNPLDSWVSFLSSLRYWSGLQCGRADRATSTARVLHQRAPR